MTGVTLHTGWYPQTYTRCCPAADVGAIVHDHGAQSLDSPYFGRYIDALTAARMSSGFEKEVAARPARCPSTTIAAAMLAETIRRLARGGNSVPAAISSADTSFANEAADTRNISSVTCLMPPTMTPNPTPGKMYALFPWPGWNLVPSSMTTESNGLPEAKSTSPLVHAYACFAVHSARCVGLERGKMIGRWLLRAMVSTTCFVKTCACAHTPMRAVGLRVATISASDLRGACGCAYSFLWCWRVAKRHLVTRPCESTSQHRRRAASCDSPSRTICATTRSAIPVPASPAPMKTTVSSRSRVPLILVATRRPASATAAVPWMSSLNVQILLRYFSSSLNAVVLPKSSNWTRMPGQRATRAVSTSSMKAS
mmetsp:Transcript_67930/g.162212  ORF Transcript_67930/g.162212 Transcript_67930/m.162212 type:complete len:369 (+) Transcript_67930:3-1109(+)